MTPVADALTRLVVRDDDGTVIAVACAKCGKLALNVTTGICVRCSNILEAVK